MKPQIHIVDDDADVRASMSGLVSNLGWVVKTFSSAFAFLRTEPHENTNLACLILDLEMPIMNGAELQATLKWQSVDFPTIVMTANPESVLSQRARAEGACAVLQKPCDMNKLVAHIHAATASLGENT
ncbi:response regulator [Gammaproteobacteria bacterium AB-CW1]|uniref:Response regulator n=1 Tax=Natronospira elongata TaxID=3110268 RepID=A0AAP6MLH8_9GAMM|nr:response regulator [Gammaproteobacteria bacterium AB-CW1]